MIMQETIQKAKATLENKQYLFKIVGIIALIIWDDVKFL